MHRHAALREEIHTRVGSIWIARAFYSNSFLFSRKRERDALVCLRVQKILLVERILSPRGEKKEEECRPDGKKRAATAAAADANVIWIQAEAVLILLRRENDTPSRTYPARLLCGLKANETARAAPNNIQSARAHTGMGTSQLLLGRRWRRRRRHRSTTFGFSSGAPAQHRRAYFLAGKSLAGFDTTMDYFAFFFFFLIPWISIDRSNRSPDIKRRRML